MYRALGQWCYTNWGKVVVLWVVVIAGLLVLASTVGPSYQAAFDLPDSESRDGFDALDEHFGGLSSGQPASVVFRSERGVDDPEVQAVMTELFEHIRSIDESIRLSSPYELSPQPQVAFAGPEAGQIAYASVTIPLNVDQAVALEWGEEIRETAGELVAEAGLADDLQIEIGGQALAEFEPPETELIGLSFAVIVLIIAFGSVMAMGLPIGVAIAGVSTGLGLVILISNVASIPDITLTIGAMIGLGVGIDYALFIVTRFRTTMAEGYDPITAIGIALDTAGRAVIFAGMTVVVSLLGMLLIGLPFIAGMGLGASVAVSMTMAASVTLLPALLGLVGPRLEVTRWRGLLSAGLVSIGLLSAGLGNLQGALLCFGAAAAVLLLGLPFVRDLPVNKVLQRLVPPRGEKPIRETLAYRWSRFIQAHPWASLLVGVGILLFLASPVLALRLGFSDEGNYPEETTTRKAYDLIVDGFGPGYNGPLLITAEVEEPQGRAAMAVIEAELNALDGVASVAVVPSDFINPAQADAYLIQLIPATAPQDAETEELLTNLRSEVLPPLSDGLELNVTGGVATSTDFTDFMQDRLLVFFGVVLAASFILLMAVFRSILVPLKAVIMNVLSIASAYGIVVAVFQWGWGGSLLGIEGAPIEPFIPLMLFAIVFGLSMDYEVFLLSRVREEYENTGDARNSVADGLAATARVITAAAAIMVVVFGAFMFEDNRTIKLFGLGLAMAVFLDASFVRMLLVPATMELLGSRNWWFPRWLDRILPNLNIEGSGRPPLPSEADSGSDNGDLASASDGDQEVDKKVGIVH